MTKFIAGNCVALIPCKPLFSMNQAERREYFQSKHILNQKDIDRGYYFTTGSGYNYAIDLKKCELITPVTNFTNRDQSLKGKVTKPVSFTKALRKYREDGSFEITTYIMFKNLKLKVVGILSGMILYWTNVDDVDYRTKMYVDEEGFVRGIGTQPLGEKQKRLCYNVKVVLK